MKFFDEFGTGVRKQRSVFNETTREKNFLQFLKSFSFAFNYFLTDMAVRETFEFDKNDGVFFFFLWKVTRKPELQNNFQNQLAETSSRRKYDFEESFWNKNLINFNLFQ